MFFIHEKEANSILTKGGLKHLVAVTPSYGIPSRDKLLHDILSKR